MEMSSEISVLFKRNSKEAHCKKNNAGLQQDQVKNLVD